jgi:hypothetical protein
MSEPMFLTFHEVTERYCGEISEGTLRNWRSMRVGPSFLKIGKAVPYRSRTRSWTAEISLSAGPSDRS